LDDDAETGDARRLLLAARRHRDGLRPGLVRDNGTLHRQIAAQTALGRVGLPEDIGGAVALLLAPENYWITGRRIEASGGMLL
jgi:NAD(P)-dependent dehydrogenase (short-subunit alcohol dehydrogenase family)